MPVLRLLAALPLTCLLHGPAHAQDPAPLAPTRSVPLTATPSVPLAPTPSVPLTSTQSVEAIQRADKLGCGVVETAEDWNGQDQHGDISVLSIEICHAVAAALLGDADKVDIVNFPAEPEALAAVHAGALELAIGITPSAEAAMMWTVGFGPAVFFDSQRFLVLEKAGLKTANDLRDKLVCAMNNTVAERTLRDEMTARAIPYALQAHSEQGEMDASVAVARCAAGAALETRLADSRADFPAAAPEFVFLPERFGVEPVVPAWRYGDQRFGLVVTYTINALIEAEALGITKANVDAARGRTDLRARRLLGSDRSVTQALGLQPDWAVRVIAAEGNYGEIFDRTVGRRFRLERGLNALWTAGGLMHPQPMQ